MAQLLTDAGVGSVLAVRLAEYGSRLLEANRRVNLTGARTPEELLPHLLDSLTVLAFVQEPLIDVGSGGGLPGIPVALALNVHVTFLESTAKKAAFLGEVVAEFGLAGEVFCERAEDAARSPSLRESFGSATARAVSSAPTTLELTVPFLRIGGCAILQRGVMDQRERDAVRDAAPMLGAATVEEHTVGGQRRLLIVRKTSPTPTRFPRRTGIPEKRPLCF
ncbi:MAG TPA: 16S rRNA (guanine(527)-N(7))-methyltransferase RsmG [Candidatus Baltobacteraceae bacterium]|nr:16S rRNA (guanine(527)-N(7))-methyltransferase RsmG [Candidatus Baltobacteraceae bacterium]